MKKILLFLIFSSFGASMARALTVSDIKVAVRQRIDDRTDPKLRYSDSILVSFINEGQRDIVARTWCLQKTSSQSLSARTTYYSLPSDLIAIQEFNLRETTSGRLRPIEEKTEQSIYEANPDYERQAGAPAYYFVRHSTSTGTTLEYGIFPVPSAASTLGTVYIDYYSQPTDVSVSTDVPLGGFRHLYPYHSALVYYAVSRIRLMDGNAIEADTYGKMYEQMLAVMADRIKQKPNYNPGFSAASSPSR